MFYYEHPDCNELDTEVTEVRNVEGIPYLALKDCIFYAQGGGQKSDRGTVSFQGQDYPVIRCVKDENQDPLLHIDCGHPEEMTGKTVHCTLDREFRDTQMKLHTALHLIHVLIEEQLKQEIENPITSDIEDDFAFNKYKHAVVASVDFDQLSLRLNELTSQDIPVKTYPDQEDPHRRYWECMGHVIPCGGIHVKSLKEIGHVTVTVHTKKGNTTVKAELK